MYLPRILLSLHSIGKTAQNMKERLPDLYLMMSQGFPIWGYPAMGGVPVVPVSQWPPLSPTHYGMHVAILYGLIVLIIVILKGR